MYSVIKINIGNGDEIDILYVYVGEKDETEFTKAIGDIVSRAENIFSSKSHKVLRSPLDETKDIFRTKIG